MAQSRLARRHPVSLAASDRQGVNILSQSPAITADMLAAAEALFGITYTEPERALMRDNLGPQIEQALRRRALAFPASLGPAHRFDPRLPGFAPPNPGDFAFTPPESPLPEADEDIAFATVAQQAGWIRSRQLSSERLTEIYLDRIARWNGTLLCYATVTADAARASARARDRLAAANTWLGPLHGIPYGLKDIFDTAGVPTGWGAEPYQNRIPETDAHIVTALNEAGAVMLGKTSVGALAYGDLWYGGRTRNPWNVDEGSSGSSAGSACAAAAGLAAFTIGTETLGSIVSPSTRCGTTGLRPTYGRISRSGAMPLCWSLDKIGPICRSVEDAGLILHAINTPDPSDPFQIFTPFGGAPDKPIQSLRLGYYPADFAAEDAVGLDHDALDAAKSIGLTLVELTRVDLPYESLMGILFAEAAAAFEELTLSNRDDELTWQSDDAWPNSFRKARFLSAVDHVQLDRLRRLVMREMDQAFRQADIIVGPSLAGPMLTITNFTGHPSLCLPAGTFASPTRTPVSLSRNVAPAAGATRTVDVPHSICLYGRLFDETTLLAVGPALEARLPKIGRPKL
jgi:Asp-tRNA(Asn)/Glu-tRNA(Gln) amidotransferase A subunit family amidase